MAEWPSSLRFGFNSNIEEEVEDGFIRTPTDIGPVIQQRRFSAVSHFLTAEVMLLPEDRLTFEAWFRTEINGGADAFDMVHPATGQRRRFRFTESPSYAIVQTASGPGSIATVNLEMLP